MEREKERGKRVDGKRVGPWTFYHHDGRTLKAKGSYDRDGLFTGLWRWYAANGALRQEGRFVKGEQHGPWRRWYGGTTQLVDEGRYEHGKRVGEWRFYDRTGALRRTRTFGAKAAGGATKRAATKTATKGRSLKTKAARAAPARPAAAPARTPRPGARRRSRTSR